MSKASVRGRDKQEYVNLVSQLNYNEPEAAHYVEGLLRVIYDSSSKSKSEL